MSAPGSWSASIEADIRKWKSKKLPRQILPSCYCAAEPCTCFEARSAEYDYNTSSAIFIRLLEAQKARALEAEKARALEAEKARALEAEK